ncbi:hypothetical protein [Desulfovibrio subterraneus]|nr:hypothetical protein [Desulfovibrio subterraneus]
MQNTIILARAFFEKMKIYVSMRLPRGLAGGKAFQTNGVRAMDCRQSGR